MRSRILLTFLIITVPCSLSFAQDQNLEITKGIPGAHLFPTLAVHPPTGNIVAVWIQYNDDENSVVMARLLKRKKNGTYKAKKVYEVSSPDTGFYYTVALAYVPEKDRFLVVWSDSSVFDEHLTEGDLYGRELKSKGKPRKKPFLILSDGFGNLFPQLVSIPASDPELPSTRKGLILCWTALPTSTDTEGSLRAQALVGNKYKLSGKQLTLEKIPFRSGVSSSDFVFEEDLAKVPVSMQALSSDSFGVLSSISLRNLSGDISLTDLFSRIFWLNVNDSGRLENVGFREFEAGFGHPTVLLPRPDKPSVPLQTVGIDFKSFSFVRKTLQATLNGSGADQRISLYTQTDEQSDVPGTPWSPEDGNPLKITALAGQNQQYSGSAPAADDRRAQFVWAEETHIYTTAIRLAGKVSVDAQPTQRVRHGGILGALTAIGVPGTSTVAIAWRKDNFDLQTSELWLHVFK